MWMIVLFSESFVGCQKPEVTSADIEVRSLSIYGRSVIAAPTSFQDVQVAAGFGQNIDGEMSVAHEFYLDLGDNSSLAFTIDATRAACACRMSSVSVTVADGTYNFLGDSPGNECGVSFFCQCGPCTACDEGSRSYSIQRATDSAIDSADYPTCGSDGLEIDVTVDGWRTHSAR